MLQPRAAVNKTRLHDLYEQEKQSPWYDNLRRPVTILEPLINSGVRGVTSNPTVCMSAVTWCFPNITDDDNFLLLMSIVLGGLRFPSVQCC